MSEQIINITAVTAPATNIVVSTPASTAMVVTGSSIKGDPGTTDYNELENLPDLTLKADKATTYTKTEVDIALTGKANTVHTHVASDVTDFNSSVSSNADVTANTAVRHTHANKAILDATSAAYTTADETKLDGIAAGAQVNTVTSVSGKTGAVTLDKTDVGLSNVDNTSDADKPVSTATQTALNAKANASDTVNLTGDQTVAGVKTFSSSPVVPTATTGTQAVNKAQMDTADALKVNKAGDTMTGTLTTTGIVQTNPAIGITSGATNNALKLSGGTINDGGTIVLNGSTAGSTGVLRVGSTDIAFWSTARLSPSTNNTIALGSPTQSWSNVYVTQATIGGVLYVTGTGFPEGVITAPVGSIYIDTAITNGASSWIKKSGTGNTGWKVLEGDTGWRDISAITAGLFDVVSPLDYGLYWRRQGNVMTFKMRSSLSRTDNTAVSGVPNVGAQGCTVRAFVQGSSSKFEDLVFKDGFLYPVNAGAIVGDRLGFVLTTQVSDAWPTTLPGVSA